MKCFSVYRGYNFKEKRRLGLVIALYTCIRNVGVREQSSNVKYHVYVLQTTVSSAADGILAIAWTSGKRRNNSRLRHLTPTPMMESATCYVSAQSENQGCCFLRRRFTNWRDASNSSATCRRPSAISLLRCWSWPRSRLRSGSRTEDTNWSGKVRIRLWSWRPCIHRVAWRCRCWWGTVNPAWATPCRPPPPTPPRTTLIHSLTPLAMALWTIYKAWTRPPVMYRTLVSKAYGPGDHRSSLVGGSLGGQPRWWRHIGGCMTTFIVCDVCLCCSDRVTNYWQTMCSHAKSLIGA